MKTKVNSGWRQGIKKKTFNDYTKGQVNHFEYLRNNIGNDRNHGIDVKLGELHTVCGITVGIFF